MQKIARPSESILLESILTQASKDVLEVKNVKVSFTYKDNAIYLGEHKIFDVLKKDEEFEFKPVNVNYDNDSVIDRFSDIIGSLKEGTSEEVEVPVTIDDIETFRDSEVNCTGEYSCFTVEKYKVYYSDSSIEISDLLKSEELSKLNRKVNEFVNKDHKPKYIGNV